MQAIERIKGKKSTCRHAPTLAQLKFSDAVLAKLQAVFGETVFDLLKPELRRAINAAVSDLLPSLVGMRELGDKGVAAIETLLHAKLVVDGHRERLETEYFCWVDADDDEGDGLACGDANAPSTRRWTNPFMERLHADLSVLSRRITGEYKLDEWLHISRQLAQTGEEIRQAA